MKLSHRKTKPRASKHFSAFVDLTGRGAKPFDRDAAADLLAPSFAKRAKAERAMDKVREKRGRNAVVKGRGFESEG